MSRIGHNIISNLGLQAWLTISQIFLVPLYIYYLGVEAYGLVGFYTSLMAVFFLLDFGFSATIHQELAKEKTDLQARIFRMDLMRTFEIAYVFIAVTGLLILVLLKDTLTHRMVRESDLGEVTIQQSILAMALLLALRLLMGLYSGALNGLQQQFKLNIILIFLEVLKFVAIILCLRFFWNHILAFFIINIVITVFTLIILRRLVWNYERTEQYQAKFRLSVLRPSIKFTRGVALISTIAAIISQVDKFVVSGMVSLEEFGYYTLAFTIASIPMKFVASVSGAVYPRLVQEHSRGNEESLVKLYHKASQLISVVIIPVSLGIFFFTIPILNIWFGNEVLTTRIEWLVKIFVIGFMLNGLMTMPYYLQLVYRWTSLSIIKNLIAILVLVPLLFYLVSTFGIEGAALIWLILNLGYLLLEIPILHSRILPSILRPWYFNCVLLPLILVGALGYLGQFLFLPGSYFGFLEWLVIGSLMTAAVLLVNRIMSEQPLWSIKGLLKP
ncbi:MAG: oligosaccharide flippase family protein [Saprospiraceae bacterium]|nr:oligosaccharide flippase family protein [Saprospiraceae bacterium]